MPDTHMTHTHKCKKIMHVYTQNIYRVLMNMNSITTLNLAHYLKTFRRVYDILFVYDTHVGGSIMIVNNKSPVVSVSRRLTTLHKHDTVPLLSA